MKCTYFRLPDFLDATEEPFFCPNEAAFTSCGGEVCAEHTCRHSIPLAEADRRRVFKSLADRFAEVGDAIELTAQIHDRFHDAVFGYPQAFLDAAALFQGASHLFRRGPR